MDRQRLERLEEEIGKLKEEIISIKKIVTIAREPIIIERINEKNLTKKRMKSNERSFKGF